jgi:polysaccharide biosynthesis/export protein
MRHLLNSRSEILRTATWILLTMSAAGCHSWAGHHSDVSRLPPVDVPHELAKAPLPDYVIEPPDVLSIDVPRIVPRGGQRLAPLDVLLIQSTATLVDQPIAGAYVVGSDGAVSLGTAYGSVQVGGMAPEDARRAIEQHLQQMLISPSVSVSLLQSSSKQPISGEHLVGPDGTVNLGIYGRVLLTGATVEEARRRITSQLARFLEQPEVSVDVVGYNSKMYYIITEGAGFGDGVNRFPVTGNETVLDAISQINGLSQVSSKKIWVSRPVPGQIGCDQVLPVDWVAVTKNGSAETNYQLMPGDRVFVSENRLVAFDTHLGKLLAPAERVFGFTLLGTTTVQAINRSPKGYLTPPGVIVGAGT